MWHACKRLATVSTANSVSTNNFSNLQQYCHSSYSLEPFDTNKMAIKIASVFRLVCLLIVIFQDRVISLPFSDDGNGLHSSPAKAQIPKRSNRTETASDHGGISQMDDNIIDVKTAFCPWYVWDADVMCVDTRGVFVSIGHCVSYEHGKGAYEFKCPYFQLEGHQVSDYPGYISLPENVSELEDYMCGPMNRKGFLCEECIDGFSVSMTSLGHKCSNCTDAWYGIPFYLATELVPITGFYLLLLVFQIHLTSAPMTSFILYCQTVMYVIAIDRPPPFERVVPQLQYEKSFLFNLNLFLYGPWNLDFFRYILPPFCVASGLNLKHQALLGYISILYPLFLIFLTWICIELHGRNFRPVVYLFAPFRKCLGRLKQGWGEKRDVVDLFSAFFLLSYSRLMYQASLFLEYGKVTHINPHSDMKIWYILVYDSNITYGSSKYIAIAVFSLLIMFVFNIVPALVLILYPFKFTRSCLSKCRLDTLCLSAFMDKFHGCYRNGLNGGKDMRSFAGVYFLLRFLPFFYYPCELYRIPFSFGSYLVLLFLSATLLVAIARPYKETYMNVFDTILLGQLTFMSKMLTDNYYDGMGTQLMSVNLIPVFSLLACLFYMKVLKVYNCRCCRRGVRNRNSQLEDALVNSMLENNVRDGNETQPLLTSGASVKQNYSTSFE